MTGVSVEVIVSSFVVTGGVSVSEEITGPSDVLVSCSVTCEGSIVVSAGFFSAEDEPSET